MDIVLQKGIDEAVWKNLTGWSEQVFPVEGRGMEWATLRWHVLAVESGNAVGHVGFDRFTVKAGGMDTSVVGVGGVVVRPEFQKQGLPARMFEKLYAECPPDARADTFTLFCPERLVPYYARHGYARINRRLKIRQFGKMTETGFAFLSRGPALSTEGGEIVLTSAPW